MKRTIEIDIDDAIPGMTLSDAVLDQQGNLLIPAGTALTEAMLKSLQRRGVDRFYVANDGISEADLAAERARIMERLGKLFRKYPASGEGNPLWLHIVEYRLGEHS